MIASSRWLWLGLVVLLTWWIWIWGSQQRRGRTGTVTTTVQRLLQPRTPDDCPSCRRQTITHVENATTRTLVRPWRTMKSRRGAPKRIDTTGFACPNHSCAYYRISDAQIHALVGDGVHGKCERIQTLRCQACGTTFSTRRDTPLYGLKTSSQRLAEVLAALAEGLSVAAAVRVFGHSERTLRTWLTRRGAQRSFAQPLLQRPPPGACATRRDPYPTTPAGACAVALAGRRSNHQTDTHSLSRSAHIGCSACGHP
jgi:hypothetical protein